MPRLKPGDPLPYWMTRDWWDSGEPPHRTLGATDLGKVMLCPRTTAAHRRNTAMTLCEKEDWGIEFTDGRSKETTPMADLDRTKDRETEIFPDGSRASKRFVELTEQEEKDPDYLLQAHGFDPSEWDLVSAKNKIWNAFSDEGGTRTLYASHITVRPRADGFTFEEIVAAAVAVEPVVVERRPAAGKKLFEPFFTDAHFGNSTIETHRRALERTVEIIRAGAPWTEIIIPVGSDLFHCDNFKNTTSNGTPVSSVDWPRAWADATVFFSTIIECALENGVTVYGYYIPGNHDESMAWAFSLFLQARYPQMVFDTEIRERKVHCFGDVAIGMTHGQSRTRKDLDRVFMAEFPEFASAGYREVHAGHYHHEISRDEFGVVVRSLSTAARTDKWHRQEGYVGAVKRFLAFRFNEDWPEGSDYL